MRLAISNIAWDPVEDTDIAALLRKYGVDAIDIAPGKYFPQPQAATKADVLRVRDWWADQGIAITGMQALLFGTTGLNMFGPPEVQDTMLAHLDAVCRIGGGLVSANGAGPTRVGFGSPKNRDRSGLDDAQTMATALSFFRRLGDSAATHGVIVCLEPNPTCYGANFMTTSAATAEVVRQVAHPAIRMQLDTGALTINGEDPAAVLQDCAALIGHVHASEENLLPLGDGSTDHARVRRALEQHLPPQLITIEMVATASEAHASSIERALEVATRAYLREEVQS